nr:TadE/TadG family type IV pilus assembly protein [Propionicimonas sp.]
MRPTRGQTGAVAVEFAMLVPVLVLLVGLVVGGARTWLARSAVEQAAAAAARGASQARTPAQAQRTAAHLASAQAAVGGLRCDRWALDVDARVLAGPPGQPGEVAATVTCEVPLADVLVPGWPGAITVQCRATAVVDRYRGRQ